MFENHSHQDHQQADDRVRVLLVDDQFIIIEAVRRMLAAYPDIELHYVTHGQDACRGGRDRVVMAPAR